MVTSPWMKLRLSPRVSRTGSFIAQDLHRVGARCLSCREKRGREGQDDGDDDDRRYFERVSLGRKIGQEANGRIPEIRAGNILDAVHDVLTEEQEDGSEDDSDDDSDCADRQSRSEEHTSELQSHVK